MLWTTLLSSLLSEFPQFEHTRQCLTATKHSRHIHCPSSCIDSFTPPSFCTTVSVCTHVCWHPILTSALRFALIKLSKVDLVVGGWQVRLQQIALFCRHLAFRIAFSTVGNNYLASPHDGDFTFDSLVFIVDKMIWGFCHWKRRRLRSPIATVTGGYYKKRKERRLLPAQDCRICLGRLSRRLRYELSWRLHWKLCQTLSWLLMSVDWWIHPQSVEEPKKGKKAALCIDWKP